MIFINTKSYPKRKFVNNLPFSKMFHNNIERSARKRFFPIYKGRLGLPNLAAGEVVEVVAFADVEGSSVEDLGSLTPALP